MKASVKYLVLIIAVLMASNSFGQRRNKLVSITQAEYNAGNRLRAKFYPDRTIEKENGRLLVGKNCMVFTDDSTNHQYYDYNYEGDLDSAHRYKVVEYLLDNGTEYFILDTKRNCKVHHLLGKPGLYGKWILNLNESETTDAKLLIEVWEISEKGISKLRTIDLGKPAEASKSVYPVELKISTGRKILIKDSKKRYWRLKDVL